MLRGELVSMATRPSGERQMGADFGAAQDTWAEVNSFFGCDTPLVCIGVGSTVLLSGCSASGDDKNVF